MKTRIAMVLMLLIMALGATTPAYAAENVIYIDIWGPTKVGGNFYYLYTFVLNGVSQYANVKWDITTNSCGANSLQTYTDYMPTLQASAYAPICAGYTTMVLSGTATVGNDTYKSANYNITILPDDFSFTVTGPTQGKMGEKLVYKIEPNITAETGDVMARVYDLNHNLVESHVESLATKEISFTPSSVGLRYIVWTVLVSYLQNYDWYQFGKSIGEKGEYPLEITPSAFSVYLPLIIH